MVFSKGSSSESSEESPKMFATKASAIFSLRVCVYSALLLNNNKNKVMLICGERRHRRKSKIREEKRRTKNDRTTKSNERG